ncbi:MAG: YfhO family protein [Anaerolineae bacterium]|nr:YfhO family protein [Anaerolineae bacterium]
MIPMLLAVGWLVGWVIKMVVAWRKKGIHSLREIDVGKPEIRLLILAGLGVFLAVGGYNPLYWVLYKLVPGFGLFRVPARWLFLYAFGAAMLSGVGLQRLWDRYAAAPPQSTPVGGKGRGGVLLLTAMLIVALTVVELFIASEAMPLAHPTAPEAFSSLRTAPAHILAAQSQEPLPGRFLSISDILFDPGDQREMTHMFAGQLDDKAIYDVVVSAKRKEILAPNLPLAWRIYAIDGYDGGVLPLQRYVDLQTLFLPADELSPDGRLRENLKHIPPFRLLSLLGVRYVITDKVHDVWIDDVFYDLAFEAVLNQGEKPGITTTDLPTLAANALGIVAYATELIPGETKTGSTVAEIQILPAGQSTPITLALTTEMVTNSPTEHRAARLRWDHALEIDRLEIEMTAAGGTLHVQGLTLIDERDGSSVPVLLSGDGRVRLVHSGDVKVYELPDALPRAYVVHEAIVIEDNAAALAAMADLTFDPAQKVILHAGPEPNLTGFEDLPGLSQVTIETYEPERIALEVTLPAPGYLVLSETNYPGWQATVDGIPSEILRANVHFRAVALEGGTHHVELAYKPASYTIGFTISLIACAALLVGLVVNRRARREGVIGQMR